MVYLSGFGNHHQTEAIPGALPTTQNSPQHCPFGLYAEQISGSAFTTARHLNLHSWMYRMQPSVVQQDFEPYHTAIAQPFATRQAPNPMRWSAFPAPNQSVDFIDGLFHISGHSKANTYLYHCNQSMTHRYFSTRDGELLFIPYLGKIQLHTEFGLLEIEPGQIAVIPRGIQFKLILCDTLAAGYLCENQGSPFKLPELGLIGANGLANPRHFLYPSAAYEDLSEDIELICKYQQHTWRAKTTHSPLNVVAWHGYYAPYLYDLALFNTINTVSFDHPDPSIFTVLTSESHTPGVANLDLVLFPPRWMVAEHTFRPPYFHRNIMSEFMGLIKGVYDAKLHGFEIGGLSIHNQMTPHGPDSAIFRQASQTKLQPEYYQNVTAFMLESRKPWLFTEQSLNHPAKQPTYTDCWQDLKKTSPF